MTNKERATKGLLYQFDDEMLVVSNQGRKYMDEFNATSHTDFKTREKIARKMFGSVGSIKRINKPIYVDYGVNVHIGENFFSNYDLVLLDVNTITIGNNVMIAPKVAIYTATHPIDAEGRNSGLEYGLPVVIKDNVWIGGSAVINPGVTVGENVVVASGSVVTKDTGDNVVVGGNPAKVIRKITEQDRINFLDFRKRSIGK